MSSFTAANDRSGTSPKQSSPKPGSPPRSNSGQGQAPVPEAATAGMKRKRSGGSLKYYAVKSGFKPGIYNTWDECFAQVKGFKGAVFQSFPSLDEAKGFFTGNATPASEMSTLSCSKFYGVQRGRQPGVYTDWSVAQDQIKGFRGPKYRRFGTWAEADQYVREGREGGAGTDGTPEEKSTAPGMTTERPKDVFGDKFPAGTGPLPSGAEDEFDPNVLLDPKTGRIVYKTPQQQSAAKLESKRTGAPGMLNIYTDGSALGNGKRRARAGVGVYFGPGDESRNVSEPLKGSRQTNQRAELTAISRALDIAPRHRDVTIFTDSKYSIDCVTVWYKNWVRNKWLTADKKPVENKDLVQSIIAKIDERTLLKVKTLFQWVKGHNKDAGNEAADRLAVRGARVGLQEPGSPVPAMKREDIDEDWGQEAGMRGAGG